MLPHRSLQHRPRIPQGSCTLMRFIIILFSPRFHNKPRLAAAIPQTYTGWMAERHDEGVLRVIAEDDQCRGGFFA